MKGDQKIISLGELKIMIYLLRFNIYIYFVLFEELLQW